MMLFNQDLGGYSSYVFGQPERKLWRVRSSYLSETLGDHCVFGFVVDRSAFIRLFVV